MVCGTTRSGCFRSSAESFERIVTKSILATEGEHVRRYPKGLRLKEGQRRRRRPLKGEDTTDAASVGVFCDDRRRTCRRPLRELPELH